MKPWIITLLAANLLGCATTPKLNSGFSTGTRIYKYDKIDRYVVIVSQEPRIFIQLRDVGTDRLIQDIVMSSRYMEPLHDCIDVVLDDQPELFVKTRNGGTGLSSTNLSIYTVFKDRIAMIGDFPLDYYCTHADIEEHLRGDVSFPQKNLALHTFNRDYTENGHTKTTAESESYRFDTHKLKFKKTPQQATPRNR
jgi:hypothetical protein